MTPCLGLFSSVTPTSQSRTLYELFVLTWHPSRALNLPHVLLPELQRNKDTVWSAALCAEVPGLFQKQLLQFLIVRLLNGTFLVLKIGSDPPLQRPGRFSGQCPCSVRRTGMIPSQLTTNRPLFSLPCFPYVNVAC